MLYQPVSQWHSLHFELLIELVAQKLTELWRFKNLAYFLTWWPSSMTYLFVNVTYWIMSYAWQNWQTNRQTDRKTDRQTDKRTYLPKCKFWQVTNRQTNILAKNCKFWQVMTPYFLLSIEIRQTNNKLRPWITNHIHFCHKEHRHKSGRTLAWALWHYDRLIPIQRWKPTQIFGKYIANVAAYIYEIVRHDIKISYV